ncbi:D-alanyl-D-alanine carboxypeptidase family protein [Prosthecomicrobium sp. N25]|uniref:D-alanyl-D-alanine carboxypeptidase family protein n=1 Tax=Prosthecomicrobium sp. N25 TaxID=3129254 RepID=UPI0030781074
MRSFPNRPSPTPAAPGLRTGRVAQWLRAGLLPLAVAAGLQVSTAGDARAQYAHAWLLFDAKTGEVLDKKNAHQAWYPASVTKLMTTYVTFQAIRSGRMKLTSPVVMSAAALSQPPSKMGFPVGTVVTVDNALKIIMVKSANDVAWALGEAVSGSEDAFVEEMNRHARRLGMTGTVWGNPNGLPDERQHTTARDLGLLARALIREFPEYADYFKLPAIQFGKITLRNHNHLMDRFPGTDGMKTGFICASGFNVVATVTRDNRRLVAVVLGSPNARSRAEKAAELFTRGFQSSGNVLAGLFGGGAKETIETMQAGPEAARPVQNIRDEVCGRNRKPVGEDADEPLQAQAPAPEEGQNGVIFPGQQPAKGRKAQPNSFLTARFDIGPPVKVYTGGADPLPDPGTTAVATGPIVVPDAKPPAAPVPQVSALVSETGPRAAPAPGSLFPPPPKADKPEIDVPAASITSRAFSLFPGFSTEPPKPATGPASGAGVAASLPPATGAPMVIAGPTPPAEPPAARPQPAAAAPVAVNPVPAAEAYPLPKPKPAAARAAVTPPKPAAPAGRASAAPAKPAAKTAASSTKVVDDKDDASRKRRKN